jgi:ligand-binding sensor domain-containing protein/signal transduction histidine kinase
MNEKTRCLKNLTRAVSLLLVLLAGLGSSAEAQRKSIKQYVHDIWTTANGLPQNGADDILQSRDGYLWLATQEGVARFDGVEFRVFDRTNIPELANSWVLMLLEDSLGGIWMRPQGGAPGVVRYAKGKAKGYRVADGLPTDQVICWEAGSGGIVWLGTTRGLVEWKDGSLKTYTSRDGLPGDTVFALGQDRAHRLWVSTTRGLGRLSGGRFETLTGTGGLPDTTIVRINGITNIFQDSRGTIWMSSPGNVIAYSDQGFRRYTPGSGLPDSVVYAIAEDHTGTIWLGTRRGLGRFADGKIVPIEVSRDAAENNIREIHEDHEGSLWLRTRKGIARYASGKFERFTQADGLTGDLVQRLFIDTEGSVWTSSSGAGVDRFRDGKFVTFSERSGLSADYVHAVFEDHSGILWVGTGGGGIDRLKDGVITAFGVKDGLPGNDVRAIGEDPEHTLWISTGGGLCTYRNGVFKTRLNANQVQNLLVGDMIVRRTGTVVISSQKRIFEVRNNALIPFEPLDSLFHGRENLVGLGESKSGSIWLSGQDSVYRFREGKLENMTAQLHLPRTGVQVVEEYPDGTIWLGAFGEGLFRYKDGKVANVTPKQGLYDYNAYSFIEDKSGSVWISCNRGVYRVKKQDLEDVADGKRSTLTSVVYGTADGLDSRECNSTGTPAACLTQDGRICFTTTRGVSIVNPEDIRLNTIPPPVVIDRFVVEGETRDVSGPVDISAGATRFEFHYAGLSFVGAEKVRYKYQLVGLDKEWMDAGSRRDAYYTRLGPGEYAFRVIAANSDGVWNETGAAVKFTLEPYFYQTSWFLGLAIFAFLTTGPTFYFYRTRSLKKRKAELEHLVQERTGELQKTLNNLKETQNQLILSEKMASLGQLTAGIAHEIKNPLNFITNFAVLSQGLTRDLRKELQAERDRVDPARAKEISELLDDLEQNVGKIDEHGKRADSIVRGMLLHSRGKSGERLETDLNALLAEYTNLAYHGMRAQDQSFNVKIETEFDPSVGRVSVVPQDLSRAFLNIVNNACYAANDKRKSVKNGFSPVVRVSARNLNGTVEIRIRDNGGGIPLAIREKIFNPFFTTKPAGAGTGLGLSLSYDIITQEHKGEIRIETEEGEYTEFIITIPRNPENGGAA